MMNPPVSSQGSKEKPCELSTARRSLPRFWIQWKKGPTEMIRLEQSEVLATRGEEMVMSALETLEAPSPAAANCAASAIVPAMSVKSAPPRRAMSQRKSEQVDARLINRLKAGDQDALEAIFNLYSAKLYNVALRILGDAGDTEEVIQ